MECCSCLRCVNTCAPFGWETAFSFGDERIPFGVRTGGCLVSVDECRSLESAEGFVPVTSAPAHATQALADTIFSRTGSGHPSPSQY
eukprot:scaffold2599_cov79-Isochrysis_galbana.AAC.1